MKWILFRDQLRCAGEWVRNPEMLPKTLLEIYNNISNKIKMLTTCLVCDSGNWFINWYKLPQSTSITALMLKMKCRHEHSAGPPNL